MKGNIDDFKELIQDIVNMENEKLTVEDLEQYISEYNIDYETGVTIIKEIFHSTYA